MIYSQRNRYGYQQQTCRPNPRDQFNLERFQRNIYHPKGNSDVLMTYNHYKRGETKVDMISRMKLDIGRVEEQIKNLGLSGQKSMTGSGMYGGSNPELGGESEMTGTIAKALVLLKAAQTLPKIYTSKPMNAARNTYGRFMNQNPQWRPGFAGELYMPGGYNWCGPNTNVKERIKRGDGAINELDQACKDHDIAYTNTKNRSDVRQADMKFLSDVNASKGNKFKKALVKGLFKAKMTAEDVGVLDPGKFANIEEPILTGSGRRRDPARQLRKRIARITKKKTNKKQKPISISKNKVMKIALKRLKRKMKH